MYGLDGIAAYVMLNKNEVITKQLTDAGISMNQNVSSLLQFLETSLNTQPAVS
jgi:hypothetical protein